MKNTSTFVAKAPEQTDTHTHIRAAGKKTKTRNVAGDRRENGSDL